MARRFGILIGVLLLGQTALAQTIESSSRSTRGYIHPDGTIEDSSRSTRGYIRSDGTIENASRSTIGYARGIKREWAAVAFFFIKF